MSAERNYDHHFLLEPALSYSKLESLCSQNTDELKKIRLCVLGDFSTQWLVKALRGYGILSGFDLQIWEAGFDQIYIQTFDSNSELYAHQPDYVLVAESHQRLLERFRALSTPERARFAESRMQELRDGLASFKKHAACKVIWFDCPAIDEGIFGSFGTCNTLSYEYQMTQYKACLWTLSTEEPELFIFPFSRLFSEFGKAQIFDPRLFYLAQNPVGLDFIPELARRVLQMLTAIEGLNLKCLVVDLDNTLWGGVVGDLGIDGLELDSPSGRPFMALQVWALELKRRGILLAVCSKNEREAAQAPFRHRDDMKLSLEDFVCFEANWNPKHENLAKIRETLNISFESMVFLDDDAVERDSVRHFLPEVVVPELPPDPEDYLDYLLSLDLFQAPRVTEVDSERTDMYRTESERHKLQKRCHSFEEYLASLEMVVALRICDEHSKKRAAQLFQRSNQFNMTQIRYTESDLTRLLNSPEYEVYCCHLKDRFGDYGLISCVVLRSLPKEIEIENWVMSCRVFKRGLEYYLITKFRELASKAQKSHLVARCIPTQKNRATAELYPQLGFRKEGDEWRLNLSSESDLCHHFSEESSS